MSVKIYNSYLIFYIEKVIIIVKVNTLVTCNEIDYKAFSINKLYKYFNENTYFYNTKMFVLWSKIF